MGEACARLREDWERACAARVVRGSVSAPVFWCCARWSVKLARMVCARSSATIANSAAHKLVLALVGQVARRLAVEQVARLRTAVPVV